MIVGAKQKVILIFPGKCKLQLTYSVILSSILNYTKKEQIWLIINNEY